MTHLTILASGKADDSAAACAALKSVELVRSPALLTSIENEAVTIAAETVSVSVCATVVWLVSGPCCVDEVSCGTEVDVRWRIVVVGVSSREPGSFEFVLVVVVTVVTVA